MKLPNPNPARFKEAYEGARRVASTVAATDELSKLRSFENKERLEALRIAYTRERDRFVQISEQDPEDKEKAAAVPPVRALTRLLAVGLGALFSF